MSSPSAAVNSDAAMVHGRPISSEKKEKILDGMKAMHLGGNTSSSHPTSGMAEPTARQSNKHSNAGRLHTKHCSIYRYIYYLIVYCYLLGFCHTYSICFDYTQLWYLVNYVCPEKWVHIENMQLFSCHHPHNSIDIKRTRLTFTINWRKCPF